MIRIQKLNEGFSSWDYSIPDSPKEIVYDFYAFTLIDLNKLSNIKSAGVERSLKNLQMAFKDGRSKLIDWHYETFLSYLPNVIYGELLHADDDTLFNYYKSDWKEIYDKYGVMPNSVHSIDVDDYTGGDRKTISDHDPKDLIKDKNFRKCAKEIFMQEDAWSALYGGEAWKNIVEGLELLMRTRSASDKEKSTIIDHIYDLQHNTAVVLNKCVKYIKDGSHSWLTNVLDHKRDIVDNWDVYFYLSSSLKRPFAFYTYHTTGRALDTKADYFEQQWDDVRNRWLDQFVREAGGRTDYLVMNEKEDYFEFSIYEDSKLTDKDKKEVHTLVKIEVTRESKKDVEFRSNLLGEIKYIDFTKSDEMNIYGVLVNMAIRSQDFIDELEQFIAKAYEFRGYKLKANHIHSMDIISRDKDDIVVQTHSGQDQFTFRNKDNGSQMKVYHMDWEDVDELFGN